MTGNLKMIVNLRNRQIMHHHFKDANLQAAEDFGRMAELGFMDIEFSMYGCTYLNPADGKMYYKVSSRAENIFEFIENASQENIYASNVMTMTEKKAVPSGMQNLIAHDVKLNLAQELKHVYPKEFFIKLYSLAEECTDNSAAELLWAEADLLEDIFDECELNQFEKLVQYVHSCRKITDATYQQLMTWLKEERKNMVDDFISKDLFEKTLYGLAYEKDGILRYTENTQKDYIYKKMYQLEQDGIFVMPIYEKTYWYNYKYRLIDVNKDFKADLRFARNETYQDKIKRLCDNKKKISANLFQKLVNESREKWGEKATETLMRYGYRWKLL